MLPTRRLAAAGLLGAWGAVLPLSIAHAQVGPVVAPHRGARRRWPPALVGTGVFLFEHLTAPVLIYGKGPLNFLMDTGINVSCISRALANRLMLANGPSRPVHTMVGVRSEPCVTIDQLQIGDRTRTKVSTPSLPLSDVDGVLGVDWLKGQRLTASVQGTAAGDQQVARRGGGGRRGRRAGPPAAWPADHRRRRPGRPSDQRHDRLGRTDHHLQHPASRARGPGRGPQRRADHPRERAHGDPGRRILLRRNALSAVHAAGRSAPGQRAGGLRRHARLRRLGPEDHAVVLGMDLLNQFDSVALDFGRSQVRFDLTDGPTTLTVLPS